MKISREAERRFVLGMQGLWPGRRWEGLDGTRVALTTCRRIRVDPLDVVGRNQDLVLSSRVVDYQPKDLDFLLYKERAGFEHGGAVSIYPRELLRLHWSWVQNEGLPTRWEKWYSSNSAIAKKVLHEIESRGPLESGDWEGSERVENYRSSKIEGLALYYLWYCMQIMIHHREGSRKFYDLTQKIFGHLPQPMSKESTINEMAIETLSWLGLSGPEGLPYLRTNEQGRGRSAITKRQIRKRAIEKGLLTEVEVEGRREAEVVGTESLPLLEDVVQGEIPRSWKPISDESEAVFPAPLDVVIANGRSLALFDFEYLWEVYKPENKRRWGYYVLPVLLGDKLVGRIEPRFDKRKKELVIARAWWEKGVELSIVATPLARGISRMSHSLGAQSMVLGTIGPPSFRSSIERQIERPGN